MPAELSFKAFGGEELDFDTLVDVAILQRKVREMDDATLCSGDLTLIFNEALRGYLITPPYIDVENSLFEVGGDPQGSSISVQIPVQGDVELFKHPSMPLSEHEEPFECKYDGGHLTFTVDMSDKTDAEVDTEIYYRLYKLLIHTQNIWGVLQEGIYTVGRVIGSELERREAQGKKATDETRQAV